MGCFVLCVCDVLVVSVVSTNRRGFEQSKSKSGVKGGVVVILKVNSLTG